MTTPSGHTHALAAWMLCASLGCQAADTARDGNVHDAASDDASAVQDASPPDASPGFDAAMRDATLSDGASSDAAPDAIHAMDAARDATPSIDATVDDSSAPTDAHVEPDAQASDATTADLDAGAPMCRTSGPCRRHEECCWFCHDEDHCH